MRGQPMAGMGIETDIITGQPRGKTLGERQAEIDLKETQATREAIHLIQDLPSVLPVLAGQLEKRLLELMKEDPLCQSILQMVGVFRMKIEVAPMVATKIRRLAMGTTLNSMTDETQVAPQGIPAQE